MRYRFNPGDYVETKEGKKGYIKTIVNSKFPEFKNINMDFGEKSQSIYTFYIHSDTERLSRSFNRIGVYDFTKKDEGKIDKLNLQGYLSVQSVAETVNELIEAVNRLEEKVNGMAQS